jgi:cation diffusion facilitator CzcD-associated flavoprotein CzcO
VLREMVQGLPGGGRDQPTTPGDAETPHIAILGTGFAGLGMAIELVEAGITSFTVYEKADGVGGTWRDNRYPGAECDVPSHLYSFSFAPKADWSTHYPEQPEILAYLEECTDRWGVRDHIRFGTEIVAARFDEDEAAWHLETGTGEEVLADVLVCGLGQLNRPKVPDIAGIDEFQGTVFHSARWDPDHDLTGERVAVIGNGASAVQFVPRIAPETARLTIFQRSANWVLPKKNPPFSPRTKQLFARFPALARAFRSFIYLTFEARFFWFRRNSRFARVIEKAAAKYREAEVPDDALRAKLVPDYPIGCKRILAVSDYFSTLVRDDVDVVDSPIERLTADALVTADGVHHPIDTLILATGFESTSFLAPLEIVGRGDQKLEEVWHDGAEAYLGLTVAGFPNLFMLYGPNTNLGHNSIVFMIECQIGYVRQCVQELISADLAFLDVRRPVMDAYNRAVQRRMRQTVWEAGCQSWYKTESGKVTNNWPTFTIEYWLATRHPRFSVFEARRRVGARN